MTSILLRGDAAQVLICAALVALDEQCSDGLDWSCGCTGRLHSESTFRCEVCGLSRPFCVYLHTSPSGAGYVGYTSKGMKRRWGEHLSPQNKCDALKKAIRRYGKDGFGHAILGWHRDESKAKDAEILWIVRLGTYVRLGHGYNLTWGGEGTVGLEPSPGTRLRMAEAARNRSPSSPETNEKRAAALRKRVYVPPSPEARTRMAAAARARAPMSAETRAKMSASRTGHAVSEEARAKISTGRTGHEVSEETRAKISETLKKRFSEDLTMSEETRRKISESMKKYRREKKK